MKSPNDLLVNAANAAQSFESPAFLLDQMFGVSFQVIIAGTPIGTMKLQGSNDFGTNVLNGNNPTLGVTNWTDITGSSQSITGAGTGVYNAVNDLFRWIKVVYTAVSGSGSISVRVNAKGA